MLIPPTPLDDSERVAALHQLRMLDSPFEERFDRYTRLAKRLFNVPIALISLVDSNRQWFKSCIGLDVRETPRDISFCGHAILDSNIFIVPDASVDERFMDNPLVVNDPKIRFYAGFPLTGLSGSRLGTLCIIDRIPRNLDPEDFEALRDIGEMVNGELASIELAGTDDLTGLPNRRGFEALARKALAVSMRDDQSASVVVIDMDDFKKINDQHGHNAGDCALADFAQLLQRSFRESDVIARFGGDEFCALLTNTDEAEAQCVLQRLSEAVAQFDEAQVKPYRLSFSEGIIEFLPDQRSDLVKLLRQADARMYKQKRKKFDSVAQNPTPSLRRY